MVVRLRTIRQWSAVCFAAVSFALAPATLFARQPTRSGRPESVLQVVPQQELPDTDNHPIHPLHEIDDAMARLPLAAVLGAALALRPKRRGTPPRMPAVVQTQIILAVVGAVIMLVVGASLARAFGIVGAANLIRYRSKIDDPKDAVVMLCALAVGLASGVGLYALAIFSTVFLIAALGVIESFEKGVKRYDLTIKAGDQTDELKPQFEAILKRFRLEYELKSSADEQVTYELGLPLEADRDRISNAILKLDPEGHAAVEWDEKKNKGK